MAEVRCENCGAAMVIPAGYNQPYLKCSSCGGHQKSPLSDNCGPKYRILDASERARSQDQTVDLAAISEDETHDQKSRPVPPNVGPAYASAAKKAAEAQKTTQTYKVINKPISEKKMFEDALGVNGYEMVLQSVAGYMGELNEKKRHAAKNKALQTLMRSKIPAELAAKVVDYAEKSPEIEKILWSDYKSSLIKGLGIFFLGLAISAGVHMLAHPRWEFVLFQVPFAVGFAYAVNAAINMAGLRIPALRNEMVHYLFVIFSVLAIVFYLIIGVWY